MAGPWRVKFVHQRVIADLGPEFEGWRFDNGVMKRVVERLGYVPWIVYGNSGSTYEEDGKDEVYGVRCVCPVCYDFAGRVSIRPLPSESPVTWEWNGSMDAPTLTPSVATQAPPNCSYHVWVRDGQIIDAGTPAHGPREA